MKVKYINNCKALFDLITWDFFWSIKEYWPCGGGGGWAIRFNDRVFIGSQLTGNFLLVSDFFGIERILWLVQSLSITYELHKKCRSDYLCVTWTENQPPPICGLVVPILICQVHQNRNHRGLMHTEFNFICIRNLWLRFWWTRNTIIGDAVQTNISPSISFSGTYKKITTFFE